MPDHTARLRAAHRFDTREERRGDANATHEIHHPGLTCWPGCPAWSSSSTGNRHDTDGQVYLAYFRNDVNTGFVWDGNIEHPIQVTREMGEPIIDTFDLPDLGGYTVSPMTLFAAFRNACDDYVTRENTR